MKHLLFTLCALILVSGCQLTRVEGEIDNVEIKVSNKDAENSNGTFCPPGQAKKGKC